MAAAKAKPKQGHLEGMEPPSIKEIDDASDDYVSKRNAWQERHGPMMEARAILQGLLKKHKLRRYEYDGKLVEIATNEVVKVRSKPASPDDDDDDDQDPDQDPDEEL